MYKSQAKTEDRRAKRPSKIPGGRLRTTPGLFQADYWIPNTDYYLQPFQNSRKNTCLCPDCQKLLPQAFCKNDARKTCILSNLFQTRQIFELSWLIACRRLNFRTLSALMTSEICQEARVFGLFQQANFSPKCILTLWKVIQLWVK